MKKLLLSVFLTFGMIFGCFATNNATDIYLLAQSGNTSDLKAVENIDVVDSDGNTALCSAIKFNDVDAYNILKKAGANTEHKCVKKIPSEQYKTFLQKVGAANKSWSFLGLGKWAWAAIGAGVAGGAVAAGMGGGGGGSSGGETSSSTNIVLNCVHGQQNGTVCLCNTGWAGVLCDTPSPCDGYTELSCGNEYIVSGTCQSGDTTYVQCVLDTENYIEQNGNIYPRLNCVHGVQNANTCVCQTGYDGILCDSIASGFIQGNDGNVYPILPCVQGYQVNDSCVCYTDYYGTLCNMRNTSCTSYDQNGRCIIVGINTSGNNYSNTININNHIYSATILGLTNSAGSDVCNIQSRPDSQSVITIENDTELLTDIYGIKSMGAKAYNAYNGGRGTINVTSHGTGNIYGIYAEDQAFNADGYIYVGHSYGVVPHSSVGNIIINASTDVGVYGVFSTGSNAYNASNTGNGTINIISNGAVVTYGLYGANTAYNAYDISVGSIIIDADTYGNVYGIFSEGDTHNAYRLSNVNNGGHGTINITTRGTGATYGMYGNSVYNYSDNYFISDLYIQNIGSGRTVGIYANTIANNSGLITINNIGTGAVIGILGNNNSTIINSGTINIIRTDYTDANEVIHSPIGTADNVFGIYAKSGSTVSNSGTINITTNGAMYGIYVESGSTVTNTGTISLNGVSCDGTTCNGSSSYNNHIVLNGSTLYNSGLMMAPQMNLNSMGGNVVAGLGSQFVVENELSGDLNISSELVQNGNQTTYIAENMIDAGDISGLNVRSASAMFDASLADNGHDVVMQMKDFDSLTDNKSLAAFLANNYANGKGMDLFGTLKSMDTSAAFTNALDGLTGLNTFTQFAHEDLSAMREISFSMNNKLFENSGRDSFDISDSMGHFSFSSSHNSGSGQYGISSDKISDNWKLGYGMAMANINTGNGDGFSRQNKMWLFYMPATYTNDSYELVVAPKAGFANSEYSRRGYNNVNYEGYIEKRIFGLMNDLRYPLSFGNWTLAPDIAFNAIVYTQSEHEEEREFGLVIPDDRTVSVETGLGLYTKYEKTFEGGSRLKLNTGLMAYREFGDSYNLKLGIQGMDGTFNLYNNDYKYRGAASMGFDYLMGRFHLYGNAQYFMDNANYMNFKGGVSYRF